MATYVTLTVNAEDIIGADFDPSRCSVWLETNTPDGLIVVDGTTVRLGGRRETPDATGVVTFANLVATNSASNPTSFGYRVRIIYVPKGSRKQGHDEVTTSDFELTANANLAAVSAAWDNVAIPVNWKSDFRTEMTALRNDAAAIVGLPTEAAAQAYNINNDATVQSALSATVGARAKRNTTATTRSATQPLLALPAPPVAPVTQSLNITPTGSVSVSAADAGNRPLVTFKGGVVSLTSLSGVDGWRNTTPDYFSTTGIQAIYSVEFDIMDTINPLEVSLRLRDNISSNGCRVWTWVDGVPQTEDFVSCGVTPSGGIFNWHLNLGAGSTGRRRVRVFLHSCDFAGFNKKATSLIQPTPHTEVKLGVLGDSWVQGSGDVLAGRTFLRTAALFMGADAYCDGQGGTGYVEATTNPDFDNYGDRLTGLAAAPIDYLIVEGSLNDDVNNNASAATIQAAATALYDAWQALRPDCPIVVIGVQSVGNDPTNGDTNADRIANNNAVKAAANAHPHVLGFIDPLGEQWITGTGYVGATTGDGAADWAKNSLYHLSLAGSDMVAQRAAARILDVIGA